MQQLVYFSDAKARQFVSEKRRLPALTALRFSATVGLPFAEATPEAEFKPQSAGAARIIQRITKEIDRSQRPAPYYEDPTVRTGDWVQFETDLCAALISFRSHRMVFFAPSPEVTGDVVLLLYGSPRHKIGSLLDQTAVGVQDLDSDYSSLAMMVQSAAEGDMEDVTVASADDFRIGAAKMAERVNQHCHSFSPMFGYAQVIAVLDCSRRIALGGIDGAPQHWPTRLVVASPLFVEHSGTRPNPGWSFGAPED
ncbi:SAVMC3_10250 family protein [Streptomyces sp. NPDC056519]|uniref:SAVMC3_10250 family protein n=1 Tax=Streptomyces sp. NPDC056519 TaxID=3345849 RepID=UPI0036B9D740